MRCWACTASRTLRAGSRGSIALGTQVSSWPCTWRWSIPLSLDWQATVAWAHHCLHCTYLESHWWALRAGQTVPGSHHGHVSAVSEAPGQFPWHHPSSEKSSYQSKGELATQGRRERWRCWWPWGLLLHFLFATLAEIHHLHQIPIRDFKSQMQHFLQQQIIFSPKVTQKLEDALHKHGSISWLDLDCGLFSSSRIISTVE